MIILTAIYLLLICSLHAVATTLSAGEPVKVELSELYLRLNKAPAEVKSIIFNTRLDGSDREFQCAYIFGRLRVSCMIDAILLR